jgi:hypothetical protein
MNKFSLKRFVPLSVLLILYLSSCRAIAGIFKAGVWFGVIGIIIVIAIILWIVKKMKK